ncbi:hypothetical protein ABH853_07535 [Pseudomonas sp. 13.2]|uniref:Uncharacterized protein n=1 Tax=Pseudomonas sp. 13.2 TaxID=3144665 RepID=A0AAU7BJT0_9PSED
MLVDRQVTIGIMGECEGFWRTAARGERQRFQQETVVFVVFIRRNLTGVVIKAGDADTNIVNAVVIECLLAGRAACLIFGDLAAAVFDRAQSPSRS